MKQRGFSLAELLLALLILGQIAVFTIPKVLTAQYDSQREAVFKETIAALNDITYTATLKQDLSDTNFYTYFRDRLNVIRACPAGVSPNCWPQAVTSPDAFNSQGFKLSNGATLTSFNACCDEGDGQEANMISIDWNGPAGPNVFGDDQCDFVLSWGTIPYTAWGGSGYRPGTVMPDHSKASCVTLYQNLYN